MLVDWLGNFLQIYLGPQRSVGGTVLLLRAACRPRFTAARPTPACRKQTPSESHRTSWV